MSISCTIVLQDVTIGRGWLEGSWDLHVFFFFLQLPKTPLFQYTKLKNAINAITCGQ